MRDSPSRWAPRRAEKRVALEALVGPDREQAELAIAAEPAGVPAVRGRRNIGPGEQGERDVGDLHGKASVLESSFSAPSDAATARRRRARQPRVRARPPSRPRRRTRRATTRGAASRTAARARM